MKSTITIAYERDTEIHGVIGVTAEIDDATLNAAENEGLLVSEVIKNCRKALDAREEQLDEKAVNSILTS